MMTAAELRARLETIQGEMRGIHEGAGERSLNDDEMTRWSALENDEREVQEGIKQAEAAEAQAARVAERRARWGSVQVTPTRTDPFADWNRGSEADIRNRAREVVSEIRYEGVVLPEGAREAALRYVDAIPRFRGAPSAADLVMATSSPDYMSAYRSWLHSSGSPIYTAAEAEAVRAAMSLTSANGGYTLPFLLDPTLIATGSIGRNPIRAISRVETGTQNVWHGVTISNITTYWKGEGSAFTDGSPTTGGPSVTAAQLTAYVIVSDELFEDSTLAGQLAPRVSEAFDDAESAAFVVGSGSTAPKGIITAISATAGSTVTATTRGSFTSASGADTFAVLNAVPSRYEDNVTWVGNKITKNTIRQQTIGTTGAMVAEMTERGTLLDSPWVSASSVTSTTTSGNVLLVLGDFSNFLIYDRLGTTAEFVPNVVDGSGLPTGQRGFLFRKRVGSDCLAVDAFRFLKA